MINNNIFLEKIKQHHLIFSVILISLVLLKILSFTIENEMFHKIPTYIPFYNKMVTIAISDLNYNLKGYVGYRKVYDTLKSNGFTYKNSGNGEVLNNALHQALEVKELGTDLITNYHYGLGGIDYIKFSFAVFVYSVESLSYLFYLLLFIQVIVFLSEFYKKKNIVALLIVPILPVVA